MALCPTCNQVMLSERPHRHPTEPTTAVGRDVLCRVLYRGGPVHEIGPTVRCGRPFGHAGDHKGAVSGGGRAHPVKSASTSEPGHD